MIPQSKEEKLRSGNRKKERQWAREDRRWDWKFRIVLGLTVLAEILFFIYW
jgi:hypothetical protein